MELTYKKKDGSALTCWYRDFCDTLEVLGLNDGEEFGPFIHLPVEVHKDWDNLDCEFEWDGEIFQFKNFEALSVDALIQKIETARSEASRTGSRPWVNSDEALLTFFKYSTDIGIVAKVECFSTVVPYLGFGLKGTGSKIARVLMVPTEDRYKKLDWHYKIDLKAYDEEKYGTYIGREHLYFSDLWSIIVERPDIYELVNLNTYLNEPNPVLFELTGETHS